MILSIALSLALSQVPPDLTLDGVVAADPAILADLDRYYQSRTVLSPRWLSDGSLLFATRMAETYQIHRIARPGGAREQLTFLPEPVIAVEPRPGALLGFAFVQDEGGSENDSVFYFDLNQRELRRLTSKGADYGGLLWNPQGTALVASKRIDDENVGLVLIDPETGGESLLVGDSGRWSAVRWAQDGESVLVWERSSGAHLVTFDSEGPIAIDLPSPLRSAALIDRNPVSGAIYATAPDESGFFRLWEARPGAATASLVTKGEPHDVEEFTISDDGQTLACVLNVDGRSRLAMYNTKSKERLVAPELPAGIVYSIGFRPESDQLRFVLSSSRSSGDLFTFQPGEEQSVRWTRSEIGGLDIERLVPAQLVKIPSEGDAPRVDIPAFLYQAETSGKSPVLIQFHGGPQGQSRPYFSSFVQYMAQRNGISVLLPNVRGSTGSGATYESLDDQFKRVGVFDDIAGILAWIKAQPALDESNVVVMGASYGGFMALSAAARFPDRVKCAISLVGVGDLVELLESHQGDARARRRIEYGDESDSEVREFLLSISPISRAESIRCPVLVGQGANDPRVSKKLAESLVAKLRANGVKTGYVLAENEGHGFRRRANRRYWSALVTSFILENIERGDGR